MRTDCKISTRKKIYCPNASRIGYGKYQASVGDIIVYREHHQDDSYTLRTARMIGSVTAPKIHPDDAEIKDWILVLTLAEDGHTCFERWINPNWVYQISSAPTKFAAFFFQEKLPYDVNTLRRLHEHGSLSDDYIDNVANVVKKWESNK